MTLRRLKLRPRSPWRTPWQADTLTGMLMAVCARVHGAEVLRDLIIAPMLEGKPPFVLSDACPGDLLPMPICLRLADWPEEADRKRLKRARWLQPVDFQRARRGEMPAASALIADDEVLCEHTRQHNTLDRLSDTTADAESGLGIFNRPETVLHPARSAANGADYLSVYIRILEPGADDLLLEFFHDLALVGFGADTATGRGQFDILGGPEAVPELDQAIENANSVIALSTFQPGPGDPVNGLWDAFPKFAKLGPDLGVPDVRKNTLILFRPGACFHAAGNPQPVFLGRAVPMNELLPPETVDILLRRAVTVVHPAFALTVPAALDPELFS